MKTSRHNAFALCPDCKETIWSNGGGRFVSCSCKASSLDQERWSGLYARSIGKAELIEVICPESCEHRDPETFRNHTHRLIETVDELKSYIQEHYPSLVGTRQWKELN